MAKVHYYDSVAAYIGVLREALSEDLERERISSNNPDPNKSKDNVRLDTKGDYGNIEGLESFFDPDNITKHFNLPRKVRKDSSLLCGTIITLPEELHNAPKEIQIEFFETMRQANLRYWLTRDMGYKDEAKVEQLIKDAEICTVIHYDEKTPHMHQYFCPLKMTDKGYSFCRKEVMPDIRQNAAKFNGYHDYLQESLVPTKFRNVKVTDKAKRAEKKLRESRGDYSMSAMSLMEYKEIYGKRDLIKLLDQKIANEQELIDTLDLLREENKKLREENKALVQDNFTEQTTNKNLHVQNSELSKSITSKKEQVEVIDKKLSIANSELETKETTLKQYNNAIQKRSMRLNSLNNQIATAEPFELSDAITIAHNTAKALNPTRSDEDIADQTLYELTQTPKINLQIVLKALELLKGKLKEIYQKVFKSREYIEKFRDDDLSMDHFQELTHKKSHHKSYSR